MTGQAEPFDPLEWGGLEIICRCGGERRTPITRITCVKWDTVARDPVYAYSHERRNVWLPNPQAEAFPLRNSSRSIRFLCRRCRRDARISMTKWLGWLKSAQRVGLRQIDLVHLTRL